MLKIPDMNDAEARDRYMRGLKPEIAKEVLLRDCRSLNEMIKIAERFDLLSNNSKTRSYPAEVRHPGVTPNAAYVPVHADLMDVDAVQILEEKKEQDNIIAVARVQQTPRRPITDVERRQLSRNQACFYCRQPGHYKKDCPLRPSRSSHQGNGGQRQ
jgi:hypothetical protein